MAVLILRVESQGQLLGEFALDDQALVLRLQDGDSGAVISTLTLEPGQGQPASAGYAEPFLPAPGGNLFHDETVDLGHGSDSTLTEGLRRIREAARGAPSTVNVQLPRALSPEPEEPDLIEAHETSLSLDVSLPLGGRSTERRLPAEADTMRREPGLDHDQGPSLGVSPLPPPDQDRSITRTLSDGLQDLLRFTARHADPEAESQGIITESIESEDAGRPTHIERPLVEVDPFDEGPPTKISDEPYLPQPIAPGPDPEDSGPLGREETLSLGRFDHDGLDDPALPAGPEPVVSVPTDFADEEDEAVTVVAQAPTAEPAVELGPLAGGSFDEVPMSAQRGRPEDPGLVGPGGTYDELPFPERGRREVDDDLSLSLPYEPGLTDASIDDLSLPVPGGELTNSHVESSLSLSLPMPADGLFDPDSDDDITLPLPEESSISGPREPLGGTVEATVTSGIGALHVEPLGPPQSVRPRLMDTTAGLERDPSTERLEGAEVWFRRHGEWTPRGALSLGQHVQAFGGMVRCDDNGGLVVLAGPRLHGSATMPSGELRQINAGQQAVHLPAGTSVILWQGEQGIYVRSNIPADASGPVLDQGPVVYRRPPRSRSWKPPASDLEDT